MPMLIEAFTEKQLSTKPVIQIWFGEEKELTLISLRRREPTQIGCMPTVQAHKPRAWPSADPDRHVVTA